MEYLSHAWRRVFSENGRCTGTVHEGQLLSFPIFAACRLLRVAPLTENKGYIYKALVEIAKNYLKADVDGISNCITRYRITSLMNDIADTSSDCPHDLLMLKDLMMLLEKLLLEYLGENWDVVEHVFVVNRESEMRNSESTASFSRYRNASSQALQATERARRNWQRAYRLAIRKIVQETFAVKRTVVTLTQLFKEYQRASSSSESRSDDTSQRRAPVLLLLGGGMAAGKSTVRQIIGSDAFWSNVGTDAVVVEADAIKNHDVVFHALQDRLGDDPGISQLVHEYSTNAAEAMLVFAVNEQRDIVFDGTMTWLPFVEQTIAMVRDHEHNYKRGPGYYHDQTGKAHEKYWEIDTDAVVEPGTKLPYRIELVGVTCDPGLAVARGIWRKIRTGRGVPVAQQLRSHRLFSQNFEAMARLVDSATLYHTGHNLTTFTHCDEEIKSPKVICHVSSVTRGELLVNPAAMREFSEIKNLNDSATCVSTLYTRLSPMSKNERLSRTFTKNISASPVSSLRSKLVEANRVATEEGLE